MTTDRITERQLDLITRAHNETGGLIEPLLELNGGTKLKMIASLAKRGLIAQVDGQWRITQAAVAIIEGDAHPDDVPPAVTEAATVLEAPYDRSVVCAKEGEDLRQAHEETIAKLRANSKLATIINLLRSEQGATIQQMAAATGWQAHSVRGALTAIIKHRLGLPVVAEKPEGSKVKVYRLGI